MGKKKSVYVWVLMILFVIGIVFSLISLIFNFINVKTLLEPAAFSNPVVNIIDLVLSIIGLIIMIIFFIKLYNITPDIIKWTHITFGFMVLSSFLQVILIFFTAGLLAILAIIPLIIVLAIIIPIWITFALHLKKAQREGKMDFS